jgi:hypothetical protein
MSITNADCKHLEDLVREWAFAKRHLVDTRIPLRKAVEAEEQASDALLAFAVELGLLV